MGAFSERDSLVRRDIITLASNLSQPVEPYVFQLFGEYAYELERVRGLADRLREAPISTAPFAHVQQLQQVTRALASVVEKIKQSGQQLHTHTTVVDEFLTASRQFYTEAAPLYGYSLPSDDVVANIEQRVELQMAESRSQLDGMVDFLNKTTAEATQTLEAAKEAAQSYGISAQSQYFESQAQEHLQSGKGWLVATIAIAIVIIALAALSANYYLINPPASNTVINVQLLVAKAILFSVLFSALVTTAKSYRAHRHNYVVNKHRQNALMTFRAFSSLANADPATKNAVLLQTTQCIFGPQPTGYSTTDADTSYPPVLEFVKSLTAAQK